MFGKKSWFRMVPFAIVFLTAFTIGFGQDNDKLKDGKESGRAVMWESVDISQRDLYWGPGGEAMQPKLRNAVFVAHQPGGEQSKIPD